MFTVLKTNISIRYYPILYNYQFFIYRIAVFYLKIVFDLYWFFCHLFSLLTFSRCMDLWVIFWNSWSGKCKYSLIGFWVRSEHPRGASAHFRLHLFASVIARILSIFFFYQLNYNKPLIILCLIKLTPTKIKF